MQGEGATMNDDEKVKEIEKNYKAFCDSMFTPNEVNWLTIRSWYISHVGQLLSLLSCQEKRIEELEEGIRKHQQKGEDGGYILEHDRELYKFLE